MYPADLSYRMPPEWARHERTLISWPVQASMCYPEDYARVCRGYAEIIRAVAEFEAVTVLVNSADIEGVTARFPERRIEILPLEHNDAWLRDNGPTFLIGEDGKRAGVNWRFNAWGEKYAPWDLDDQVAPQVLQYFGCRQFDAPLILEGGSIHVDGEGTLLTTEECLLNVNRNRGLSKREVEAHLTAFLNIRKVVWLKRGLSGDETDGHIDNIACFAAPGKVLMQVCDDPEDENYSVTQENRRILQNETDARGRKLELIPIQQPPALSEDGRRLTLSYLNAYLVNGGLILPLFGGSAAATDDLAARVFAQTFPGRRLRAVDGMTVIREGGNVHCLTQQMPASGDSDGERAAINRVESRRQGRVGAWDNEGSGSEWREAK
ncbi:MAG: agmatine deiminase family protein [Peptococcaceae bacterium]|nr:agmatine deiminase family protein [Peptococcaceae bacterium]